MAYVEDRWRRKDGTPTERDGKGLRWRVYWEQGGKRSKSFRTQALANAHIKELHKSLAPGVHYPTTRSVTVAQWADMWEAQQIHQRESSRQQIRRRVSNSIAPVLGHKRLETLTRADVQAAVIEWSSTLQPSTVKLTYTYLSGMMKAAVLDGYIRSTPCVGIRLPKADVERVRPLSTEAVQAIVDAIWVPYKPLVVFGAATGMRGAEMRGLTWDRVDLVKGVVTVDRQLITRNATKLEWGPPKTTSSVRTISIGAATVDLLDQLARGSELVFQSEGRALTRQNAGDAWRAVGKKVEGIGTGYHQLRHYHASQPIAGGMSPVAVAHRLGHKDANETLATYAHMWPDDDTRAAAITDGIVFVNSPH